VEIFSANPAMMNGLYPKKGDIVIGADADIVVADMSKPFHIRGEDLHTIQKITPYEGIKGKGAPVLTMVRGEIIYEDGQVVGKRGYGEFQSPI